MAGKRSPPPEPASGRSPRPAPPAWLDALALGAGGGLLAWWSWGRWPDVVVDFGRELYIPWRLLAGETLHVDLAYFNGPLSPHLNALAYRLMGPSLRTLVLANLAVLAAVTALFYLGLRRLAGRLAAVVGSLFFLAVFAFAQYLGIGNFNFVTPYSHEITHGTLLSLTALAGLAFYLETRRSGGLVIAGLALGLVFLTKAELFLAAAGGVVGGFAVDAWSRRAPPRSWMRGGLPLAACAVAPPAAALLLFLRRQSPAEAVRSVLGTWPYVFAPGVKELYFYREGMGLDRLGANLLSAAGWGAGISVAVAVGAALSVALRRPSRFRAVAIGLVSLGAAALIAWGRARLVWGDLPKPLPLLLLAGWAALALRLGRQRSERSPDHKTALAFAATSFAALLLLKMLFNTRFYQYGFALAAPATLLVIGALVGWLPRALDRRGAWGTGVRVWTIALILAVAGVHLEFSHDHYRAKTIRVGTGADSFLADQRGRFAITVLDRLATVTPPQATLAVLPEGVMVNYLARRVNPTPYVNFMPPELLMFGEDRILAAFRSTPPDFILLVNRGAKEYGLRLLGRDYGQRLMAWVQESYQLVEELREPSIAGELFSYGLLLRRAE